MNIIPDLTVWFCRDTEISKSDQRDFNLADEQYNYFYSRVVATVPKCYYIRASGSEWLGSVKVGLPYLTLYNCDYLFYRNTGFLNRYFYAYIDSVEYIDTNTTKVNFTIDQYQTWLLDYELKLCLVLREHLENDGPDVPVRVLKNSELFISGIQRTIGHTSIIDTQGIQYILIYCRPKNFYLDKLSGLVNNLSLAVRVYFCKNDPALLFALLTEVTAIWSGWVPFKSVYYVDVTGGLSQFIIDHPGINYIGAGLGNDDNPIKFSIDIDIDTNEYLVTPLKKLGIKNFKSLCSPTATFLIDSDFGLHINNLLLLDVQNNKFTLRITECVIPDPYILIQIVGQYAGVETLSINTLGMLLYTSGFPTLHIEDSPIGMNDLVGGVLNLGKTALGVYGALTGNPITTTKALTPEQLFQDDIYDDNNQLARQVLDQSENMDSAVATYAYYNRNRLNKSAEHARILNAIVDYGGAIKKRLELGIGGSTKLTTNQSDGQFAILQALCTGKFNIYYNIFIAVNYDQVDSMYLRLGYSTLDYKIPNTKLRPHWNYVQTSDAIVVGPIPEAAKLYIESMYNSGVTFWHDDNLYNYDRDNF